MHNRVSRASLIELKASFMTTNDTTFFSPNYETARHRFRKAAEDAKLQVETHTITSEGPNGLDLSIDTAIAGTSQAQQALILSSGLHGVEGFLGSAIQLAILEQWLANLSAPPPLKIILIHALNPYGFAWCRRANEDNIDLNRNFLLSGDRYKGAPEAYRNLLDFLNPQRPPTRFDGPLFLCRAAWEISRHGMPTLRQAVAGGQYDYPHGLFFGGHEPSELVYILDRHLPQWLDKMSSVFHLDFHTGLGAWATYKLLLDCVVTTSRLAWLQTHFDPPGIENLLASTSKHNVAYQTSGSLGKWCQAKMASCDYVFLGAEFGTYGAIKMAAGLRAENQAHHWGQPQTTSTKRAKQQLQELFCPASLAWRQRTLAQGVELVMKAVQIMTESPPQTPVAHVPSD
jgi:hypothetical protein